MAKALLINPSSFRTYGSNEGGIAFPVVPVLGLASLAGAARDRGHDVRILDLSYRVYDPALIRTVLRQEHPDVVGVTATTPLMNQARDISFLAKATVPDAVTVLGGSHPSALPGRSLGESAFDLVAQGEADFVVADLLDGDDPASVPGLWQRTAAGARSPTVSGKLLDDLDDLPMPCWEQYPEEASRYLTTFVARHLPMTVIEFSRGCIYGCDFCASKNTLGRGYRKKSPERCVEELERLARHGIREVLLVDDIFTTDGNWAAAVCEAIVRSGVDMAWTAQNGIRVESVDPELLELMARAGCYRVYFGFESGSDEVLKAFGKGGRASVVNGIRAVDLARRAGLETNGYFMVGLTGDTEATMQATIDFAKEARLDTMKCGICVPFPGTPMFQQLHRDGRIRSYDWDDYTVYNKAKPVFDHPTLSWEAIGRAFRRFYLETMVADPAYLWRRLRFMVRNREVLVTLRYTLRFFRAIWARDEPEQESNYAHEADWRPHDASAGTTLEEMPVPRVRRRGTKKHPRRPEEDPVGELAG